MSMLYVLIPLALLLLSVAVWALIWAIRSGQFDDLESHGWSVVLDDDQRPPPHPDDNDPDNEEPDDEEADHEEGGKEAS